MLRRRDFLRSAVVGSALLSGCSSGETGGAPAGTDVVVGPNGSLTFDPKSLTISVGDTVTWYFASDSHNVACDPALSNVCSLPDGGEPFASYSDGNEYVTDEQGTTYEHTFGTTGTYEYVCVPHAPGMAGTIRVEE